MLVPYLCILIAALLPYVWTTIAKASGDGRYDNRDPRAWLARQESSKAKRANNAQLNAFEAFPAFAASVLMAHFAGVDMQRIGWLSIAFVVFRVLHGAFYVANNHKLRSLAWFGGFLCMIALMVMAILRFA